MLPHVAVPAPSAQPLPTPVNLAAVAPVPVNAAANVVFNAVPPNTSPVALLNNTRYAALNEPSGELGDARRAALLAGRDAASARAANRFPPLGASGSFLAQVLGQVTTPHNAIYQTFDYPAPFRVSDEQARRQALASSPAPPEVALVAQQVAQQVSGSEAAALSAPKLSGFQSSRLDASLVKRAGADAYLASVARNFAQIKGVPVQARTSI